MYFYNQMLVYNCYSHIYIATIYIVPEPVGGPVY